MPAVCPNSDLTPLLGTALPFGVDLINGFAKIAPCVGLVLEWAEVVIQAEADAEARVEVGAEAEVDAEVEAETETDAEAEVEV